MQSNVSPTTSLAGVVAPGGGGEGPIDFSGVRTRRFSEQLIHAVLFVCGAISIITTVGVVVVLFSQAIAFFREVPITSFLFGTRWTALFNNPSFGVLPLVAGTVIIAGIAMLVAIPLGLASAAYLSEYASPKARDVLKPALEFLAGVPTIVYGYFALTFITPSLLRPVLPGIGAFNALSAGIAVGILTVPLIASLSEDAMRAVPRSLREGGYALGATKFEVASKIVFPAAISGIVAASILGLSVAIGETMIVSLASGAKPTDNGNPLEPMQTMTGYIVQVFTGDVSAGSTRYVSLFAVGLLLFVMTLTLNIVSQLVAARFREAYE